MRLRDLPESFARSTERLNTVIGRATAWLCLVVVLVGAFNAIARYVSKYTAFHLSSNAYLELQWYLFSLIFLLGAAYTLVRDEHVRVDILIQRVRPRVRSWINLLGTALFLIPFCVFMIWSSWFPIRASWAVLERSPDPDGLPRYPIKTMILVAFVLLLAQGVAWLIREIQHLRRGDEPPPVREGHL
jgi:TRAP-type mannitol/chloroaromatic compound transport system permease small subunit